MRNGRILATLLCAFILTSTLTAQTPFDVDPEYIFYTGGTDSEQHPVLRADRSGHIILAGNTVSADFPLHPPVPGVSTGGAVVVKFRQHDGEIVFSRQLISQARVHDVGIGRNDDIVLFLEGNIDALLTPDARLRTRTRGALVVIDCIGEVSYASYVPVDGLREFVDMDVDGCGNIYLLAHTYESPPMATQDAIFPRNQGSEDGFVMKFSGVDHQLVYATCFGGDGHEEFMHIAVDDSSFAIFGVLFRGSGYPLVNAMQSKIAGKFDFVLSRISSDGQRILYSTYLGGKDEEHWNTSSAFSRRMRFDSHGNLYLVGESRSADFPITDTIPGMAQGALDIVLCQFSHAGQLRFSARVGGTENEGASEIDVDDCGQVMLTGWSSSSGFPLVQPLMQEPRSFLSVVDTRTADLRFSTALGMLMSPTITLDDSTLYLGGTAGLQGAFNESLPPTPGYPGPNPTGTDFLVSALVMPALCPRCDWNGDESEHAGIAAELEMRDTLLIDMRRQFVQPPVFEAKLRVRNISSILSTDSIEVTLSLPRALMRDGMAAPLHVIDSPLPPGGQRTYSWMLRAIADSLRTKVSVNVRAVVSQRSYCSYPVHPEHTIFIVPDDFSYVEASCTLDCPDSLRLRADGMRLASDTARLNLIVRNLSDDVMPIGQIRLAFPPDAGVTAIEPPTLVRHTPPITPRGTVALSWKLRFRSWEYDRSVPFTVSIADTFGLPALSCETSMFVPGAAASSCRIDAPEDVSCLPNGTSLPSPIPLRLTIENPADTMRFYSGIRLDLSAAPHLQSAPGDSIAREAFYIRDGFRRVFEWRLALKPGVTSHASDTVVAYYTTLSDGVPHSCAHVFALRFLNEELSCGIRAEDVLGLDPATGGLVQDSMLVEAVFWNNGGSVQPLSHAVLQAPAEHGVTVIGDAEQPLHDLDPGARDTLRWHTVIPGYPHARRIPFTVIAYREDDTEATHCEHFTDVSSVVPFCDIEVPDTVRYDPATGTYTPVAFDIVAHLFNPSDTALGFVRAEVETAAMHRLRMLSNSSAERTDLLPRGSWELRWQCEPVWSDAGEDETIRVAFTLVTRGEVISCERVIHVEGAPVVYDLACESAGHDTVWADGYYEQLIPNPLQLQYALRNDGQTVVPSCAVAIVPPPMLALLPGQDSIRMYPPLAPGERYEAEWMLGINENRVTPGPWTVQWSVTCGDSVLSLGCAMHIGLTQDSPAGLVATPWLLRFDAEKDGPLPDAQHVDLWTGGGTEPAWSILGQPPWLEAVPQSGSGHVQMRVQPNTTALAVGLYTGTLAFSHTPLRSGDIRVLYDIHDVLSVEHAVPAGTLFLDPPYPNPVREGADVAVAFRASPSSDVRITVHDVLGRMLKRLPFIADARGRGHVLLSTAGLRAGNYRVSIRTGSGTRSRMLVVVR